MIWHPYMIDSEAADALYFTVAADPGTWHRSLRLLTEQSWFMLGRCRNWLGIWRLALERAGPTSARSMGQIKTWLRRCVNNHEECSIPVDASIQLHVPKSLLDLGSQNLDDQVVLLDNADSFIDIDVDKGPSYAALSYCLGFCCIGYYNVNNHSHTSGRHLDLQSSYSISGGYSSCSQT